MTSPHRLKSLNWSDATDAIRALRSDFLKGVPDLPSLELREWKGKNDLLRHAYAEAVLWNFFFGREAPELPDEIAEYHPFGEKTPELKTLMQWQGAVAMYPTCGEKTVHLRYLYLFRPQVFDKNWLDHKNSLCSSEAIGNDVLIYITDDFSPVNDIQDGNSWQFAFWMARRAVDSEPEIRERLATKYLLTGAVCNGELEAVAIKGKTSLLEKYELNFLIPEGNESDLKDFPRERYQPISDTDQGWRFISGRGIEKGEIRIPDPVKELHILVGNSLSPVLAVILLLNPEKICLWYSNKTSSQADSILFILRQINLKFTLEKKYMDSHDLQQAYIDLDQALKSKKDRTGVVISNTGGNRLMGFAALQIAQTYKISVVYRDIDAKYNYLTGIQFENGRSFTSNFEINRCPVKNIINWDLLYNERPPLPEDFSRRLIMKT